MPTTSAPAVPSGEVQGKADTERALQAYRGTATAYQDDVSALHEQAQAMSAMANRLCEQLQAAELGVLTMRAVAAVQDQAGVVARTCGQLGPALEAELSALAEFEAAVAAHDAVEAAALANTDGGTTEYHSE